MHTHASDVDSEGLAATSETRRCEGPGAQRGGLAFFVGVDLMDFLDGVDFFLLAFFSALLYTRE